MDSVIPPALVVVAGVGQAFTADICPYIRPVVFDWYNDVRT